MNTESSGRQLPINIKDILDMLPQRYPFIMVDRVLELEEGKSITALKNVAANEPFFQGHFPGEPVMPGVLILEGLAQAGSLLAYLSAPEVLEGHLFYFAGLDGVRFRRIVRPGDQLVFKLELLKMKSKVAKMKGNAYVDDQLVAEAEIMAAFR